MQHNESYATISEYVKELPGEDLRRWNLEIFKKYPEIEKETVEKLEELKKKEEERIKAYELAMEIEKKEEIEEYLRESIKDKQMRRKLNYLKHAEREEEIKAILKHLQENEHKNYMQMRLKIIRRALNKITDIEFQKWLRENKKTKNLEKSRIDRIIIVVYDEELINNGLLKEYLELKKKNKSREIISEEIIEKIEEEIGEDVDEVVNKWKELKKKADEEGKEINGIKIREIWKDNIKMRTMFYYAVPGKPIRLEIITNVQEAVKRALWENEKIKEMYKLATWKKDGETNFILPEHLKIYEKEEEKITKKIKEFAIEQFKKECKAMNIKYTEPQVYISIAEICYELPTSTTKEELENYFFEKYKEFKPYAANFIKIKYEKKTERPHLYLDLIHLNPEDPTVTFKIYPKFIHNGKIYIRREIVGRKIMKELGKSSHPFNRGVAEWLLDMPKVGRLMLLKFLEYQIKEKREFLEKQEMKRKIDIYNLPAILDIEERILINLIIHGRLPSHVQTKVKKKLERRRIVEKKRHGVYVITPEFKETLEKIITG